jgi:hypothetical protein
MMDGMDFVRKVSTTAVKGKKELVLAPSSERERWGCTVLYPRGQGRQGGISGTANTSLRCLASGPSADADADRAVPAQPALSAIRRQDLQLLRDEVGHFGLERPGHHNLST